MTLQDLQFNLQDNVYSTLHNKGFTTEQQFEDELYCIVIESIIDVTHDVKPDNVHSILMEYGVMKAILQFEGNKLDYEANRDEFGLLLLEDVLRIETVFCYEEYSQRYELEETTEVFETTD